jgi:hypothetical protein
MSENRIVTLANERQKITSARIEEALKLFLGRDDPDYPYKDQIRRDLVEIAKANPQLVLDPNLLADALTREQETRRERRNENARAILQESIASFKAELAKDKARYKQFTELLLREFVWDSLCHVEGRIEQHERSRTSEQTARILNSADVVELSIDRALVAMQDGYVISLVGWDVYRAGR